MIRVVIADDQTLVRQGLASLLSYEEDIEVVGQAENGLQALEIIKTLQPDLAILDIELGDVSGLEIAQQCYEQQLNTKILIVTTFSRPGYLNRAMRAGVKGFLIKDCPAADLSTAIRSIYAGQTVIDPQIATATLRIGQNPLNEREIAILRLTITGSTLKEIAAQLFLSEGTVRNLASEAIQKLDANNRTEAALHAQELGWL